jgi:hypothetical protein
MKKLSSPIELIKDSFGIFFEKKNILPLVLVYLPLIPFQLLFYFQENLKFFPTTSVIILINLVYLVFYLLTLLAGIFVIKRVIAKESIDIKKIYVFVWKNLWKFSLLVVLVFLATLGGFVLLIIPGIIFSTWFSFANFIFVDKGLGVKASMGKSRGLVKGRFWAVLGRLLVFGLFSGLIGFIVSAVPFGIGQTLITLAGALLMLPSFLLYKELDAV